MGKHIKAKEWANIIEEAHNQEMYAKILKRGTGSVDAAEPPRGKEIFVNGRMERMNTMPNFGQMTPEQRKILKQIIDTTKSF